MALVEFARSISHRRRSLRMPRLLAVAAALLLGCRADAPLAGLEPRPGMNVIVVSFDALRADALSLYGYERSTSPQLDDFARGALVFENAYAVTPKTPSSFAAMFSARYPTRSFRNWRIDEPQPLAALFAEAGYATAGFMNNGQLSAVRGFGRGFQEYRVSTDVHAGADAETVEQALAWIEAQADAPFFVWIHLIDPHGPWEHRAASRHLYTGAEGSPPAGAAQLAGTGLVLDDPVELERQRRLYDGEIFAGDALFGLLAERLRRARLLERSLLIFTSDHGEEFMQHGMLQHGQLNEETLRIPLILHHPDVARGKRIATRVSHLDLLPTLASLTGLELDGSGLEGRDLRRSAEDADPLLGVAYLGKGWTQASIRRGSRKLIVECGLRVLAVKRPRLQLYDLERDPTETRNLAEAEPEAARALEAELWERLGMSGCQGLQDARRGRELEGLDAETLRQLETLGYIEP